jgi:hypothetical protein
MKWRVLASLEMMTLIVLHFFLLLVELSSKRDDVGHVGQTCLIESFGGVSALPCHESTN